jgi:hypothetical protein
MTGSDPARAIFGLVLKLRLRAEYIVSTKSCMHAWEEVLGARLCGFLMSGAGTPSKKRDRRPCSILDF